jgi:deoxyuridine 5'-triphosphate nucleotidohydrolase
MSKTNFQLFPETEELNKMYLEYKHAYSEGDSGIDLLMPENVIIPGQSRVLVDLGVKCQLKCYNSDTYYSYFLLARSSIYKTPLMMCNSVGLIDSTYCGNLKVAFYNTDKEDYNIKKGTRLVQLVKPNLEHSNKIEFHFGKSLRDTERNSGGFGSTGA